jgi:hypothetical protein
METDPATIVADVRWLPDLASTPPPAHAIPIYVSSQDDRPAAYLAMDSGGRWDCYGDKHHLLAVFQEILLGRGVSLLHACGLDWNGRGVVLCGRGGAGKSSVAFATYSKPRLRLLSDDIVLLCENGELLSYPTPLSVYPYHHALFPERVQTKLRARKAQNRLLGPLADFPVTGAVGRAGQRWLVARGGRIGIAAAMLRANYQRVYSREIMPADQLSDRSEVALAVYLSRGREWVVKDLDLDTARSLYLATTYEELKLGPRVTLYSINGAIDLSQHWRRVSEVSERFLGAAGQLVKITVPSGARPFEVQDFVVQTILERLG